MARIKGVRQKVPLIDVRVSRTTAIMRGRKFHYGWVVVAVTCVALLTAAGVRSTPGILMVPLEQDFHWSRATIAFSVSINLILYGCIGPFAAAVMERFGVRRSVVSALVLVAVGVASTSLMRFPWQLILMWGFLVGCGTGFLASVLSATVAARWFTERRGLVIGILSGGSSTGQLVFLPVMANITSTYGWRTTVLVIAAITAAIVPLVALFLRDRPQDVGLLPYGETGEVKPVPAPKGNPIALAFAGLGVAVRNRDIWLLSATYFVCGASTNGLIGTHLIPACIDHGYSEVSGATLLATIGIFNFFGTLASGWLADRFDNRLLLFIYFALRGLSLLYLPFSFADFYVLSLFTVFYGVDWFATVAPTIRLVTNTVGRERSGIVYGWVFTVHQLGGASAAFFAGLFRIEFGTYLQAFMLSGLMCLCAAIAVLFIGRGPSLRQRELAAAV